jgi:Fic/DOC family
MAPSRSRYRLGRDRVTYKAFDVDLHYGRIIATFSGLSGYTDAGSGSPSVLAAESVARLTDFHPFVDGNGRVARAIATWLLVRAGHRPKNLASVLLRRGSHVFRPALLR